MSDALDLPWLPEGRTIVVPGRGEVFVRHAAHPSPDAPVVLFLHGWMASCDLQFFTAYRAVADTCTVIGVDHHGHGRGLRAPSAFSLERAADDAAAVVAALGYQRVVAVGYSMGGPIALHLAHRHPHVVAGLVLQATALEWRAKLLERLRWRAMRAAGPVLRSRLVAAAGRRVVRRLLGPGHALHRHLPWVLAEMGRNEPLTISQAGRALSEYDARPFAASLGLPSEVLLTTRDRIVRPRKQRALAVATDAHVTELVDDHLAAWTSAERFAQITAAQVAAVAGAAERGAPASTN